MLLNSVKRSFLLMALGWISSAFSDNQTPTVSPIFPNEELPFHVRIELADFMLPNGIQSYASGVYHGKWVLLAGRTNGLHGFNNNNDNFPPREQNYIVYVIDPIKKEVACRSLMDPRSGLDAHQVDTLSVTSPQFYQSGSTLYLVGGYGVEQSTGNFSTKDTLTAIDLPGLIHWVLHPHHDKLVDFIRQISDPIFQVTGGYLTQVGVAPSLLVFGQNFKGAYTPSSNGDYTCQVRRFYILDTGKKLGVLKLLSKPQIPDPNFRRRDLNVVPVIKSCHGRLSPGLVAFSGVFTLTGGIWTVPVEINANGKASMPNPLLPQTFKQGMNNYACPTLGLFSKRSRDMYTLFFGGISFGFFENGVFQTDEEIPFINQVTTIKIDKENVYTQYLMDEEYPPLFSTESNPGNQLLFGAGAQFISAQRLPSYSNGVLKLDSIKEPILVGYIVGGIQSTLPNTSSPTDSAASPYIFKVTLIPRT